MSHFGPVGWTILSNHGHVLVAVSADPQATMRDVAAQVGITERAVQMIVRDLEEGGFIVRQRVGRRNHYTVVQQGRFRHPLEEGVRIGDFLALVSDASSGRHPAGPLSGPSAGLGRP